MVHPSKKAGLKCAAFPKRLFCDRGLARILGSSWGSVASFNCGHFPDCRQETNGNYENRIGYMLGIYWGYIGIMDNKMEATNARSFGMYNLFGPHSLPSPMTPSSTMRCLNLMGLCSLILHSPLCKKLKLSHPALSA